MNMKERTAVDSARRRAMKVIGVIPARYNSSRFPGKPLVDLKGKPMIWWVYQQCLKVSGLDAVYVATDDERIQKACEENGMNVIMTSTSHQTGTDRLGEVATKLAADYYINIQGDEPLIEPETVQKVIDRCLSEKGIQVVNTITPITEEEDITSPTCVKVVTNEKSEGVYLSRSPIPYPKRGQNITYMKHLGLYGLAREALMFFAGSPRGKIESIEDIEMLRFVENHYTIQFVEVQSETIAIDKKEDVARVIAAMEKMAQSEAEGNV